jgi:hypothetical protein
MYCQDFLRLTGIELLPAQLATSAGMGSAFCGQCQRVETCPVLTVDQVVVFLGTSAPAPKKENERVSVRGSKNRETAADHP